MNKSSLNLDLYKKLYLIRRSEETIRKYYMEDEMKTPVHLSVGEEAIDVGVVHALKNDDQIFGTYRNHGIYLSRTGETDKFFAELYGKKNGLAKGKAGSMHLFAPENNFMCASAVVTTIVPVAVGTALANKMKKNGKIVAVFFGDGAVEEGGFWESLNFACLHKLPILFICEDNGFAIHCPINERQGFKSIVDIVSKFDCNVFSEKTTDVETVYKLTQDAIKKQRKNAKPCFLYFKYYRYLEHVGINEDFKFGYRSKKEFEKWYKVDPVSLQRKKLIKNGFSETDLKKIEVDVNKQIENSIKLAKKAPFPDDKEVLRDVFA